MKFSSTLTPAGITAADAAGTLTHAVTWYPQDEKPLRDKGNTGGDYQAGDAWSVRFVNDINNSVITLTVYPEYTRLPTGSPDLHDIGITEQIQYTQCSDRDDPGGTEKAAWVSYDHTDALAYFTRRDAAKAARQVALRYLNEAGASQWFTWDGESWQG